MAAALMTSLDFVYELLWLTVFGAQTSFERYYCILDLQCDMPSCCSWNEKNAICKRCVCTSTRRPCTSCLPLGTGKCANSLANRQERLFSTQSSTDVGTSAVRINLDTTDSIDDVSRRDSTTSIQVNVSHDPSHTSSTLSSTSDLFIDDLMNRVYGATLINSDGGGRDTPRFIRWACIIQLSVSHYTLPGCSVGRRYVDLLVDEVNYLATGNYPSERVLVCGSVILQHGKSVKKCDDIHRLLERWITLCQQGDLDLMLQEA